MQKRGVFGYVWLILAVISIAGIAVGVHGKIAQALSSPNYQMTEAEFGSGSSYESCSKEYCAQVSIGEVGNSSSATSPEFGDIEYTEPTMEMIIVPGESNLGVLTTEHTATKIMVVKIRNYLSGGYILQILGDSPIYDGHRLATSDTPAASQPGVEQFGMNVVENTTPDKGSDPVQVPADASIFGEAAPGYATANMFKYASGDVIAQSLENSGGTDYTITMIVNISNTTPSGHYSGDFAAVLIPSL